MKSSLRAAGTVLAAALAAAAAVAARAHAGVVLAPYDPVKVGPDLAAWSEATGQKRVVLAFFNGDPAAPDACQGAWPLDETALLAQVQAFRARGGEVIVSVGGWNADELARRCTSPQALADAYGAVLERLGTDHLDLDIEGGDRVDNLEPALVDRRSAALRLLQDARRGRGKSLDVSFTLAAAPTHGFDARSLYVLQSAKAAGVRIGSVDVMLMNYRDGVSVDHLGERGIAALEQVRGELATVMPGLSEGRYWAMMSATAMIGQNDSASEKFILEDAPVLARFVRAHRMARLGFWSLARDNGGCPGAAVAAYGCSGLTQDPWAFTRAFADALKSK